MLPGLQLQGFWARFYGEQVRGIQHGEIDLLLGGEPASSDEALEALTKELPCINRLSFRFYSYKFATARFCTSSVADKRSFFDKLGITCLTSSSADCENSLTPSLRLLNPCFHIAKPRTRKLGIKQRGRWSQTQLCARLENEAGHLLLVSHMGSPF